MKDSSRWVVPWPGDGGRASMVPELSPDRAAPSVQQHILSSRVSVASPLREELSLSAAWRAQSLPSGSGREAPPLPFSTSQLETDFQDLHLGAAGSAIRQLAASSQVLGGGGAS